MTQTNDPPQISSLELIPDYQEVIAENAGGIETAETFNDLPTIDPPQIGYVEIPSSYYVSKDDIGAFDLSKTSFDNVTLSTQSSNPRGMAFSTDGTAMFEVGNSLFHQYSVSTSSEWVLMI